MKKKTSHTKSKKRKNKQRDKATDASSDELALPPVEQITAILDPTLQKPGAKKPRGKEKVHYVNGREFEEEIRVYYNTGKISEKLGESLTKIANGLSYAPNFINYSYKDDMIGDAIVKMFSALRNKKFRLDSGFSPFSYFTTIAFHAFINRIKKEKKHHQALTEYKEKVYTETMAKKDEDGNCYIYIEPLDENYNQED